MALSHSCFFFFNKTFFSIILWQCYSEQVLCQNLVSCLYGRLNFTLCGKTTQLLTSSLEFDIPAQSPQCIQKSKLVSYISF